MDAAPHDLPIATIDPPDRESGVLRLNAALRPEARYKALVEVLPGRPDRRCSTATCGSSPSKAAATEHLEHPPAWYIGPNAWTNF